MAITPRLGFKSVNRWCHPFPQHLLHQITKNQPKIPLLGLIPHWAKNGISNGHSSSGRLHLTKLLMPFASPPIITHNCQKSDWNSNIPHLAKNGLRFDCGLISQTAPKHTNNSPTHHYMPKYTPFRKNHKTVLRFGFIDSARLYPTKPLLPLHFPPLITP
jgi:hypothetical protein